MRIETGVFCCFRAQMMIKDQPVDLEFSLFISTTKKITIKNRREE